jgi:predicted MPP superfamily phosphohydrolase
MRKTFLVTALLIAFFLVALGAVYIDAFLLEPNWLKVERVTIPNPHLSEAMGDFTVVQLSDTHLRGEPGFLEEEILRTLKQLHPDVIFITGDFISRRLALPQFLAFVSRMRPAEWIYGVPGDDDRAIIGDKLADDSWRRAGMSLLLDEVVPIVWRGTRGKRLWLIGAGPSFDWSTVDKEVTNGEPIVVLTHRPAHVKQAALAGVDLVLAGDTHGCQMGIPALRSISPYAQRGPYVNGLYGVKDTLLYVNRGTGWKTRRARFFCRPELTVFSFVPGGKAQGLQVLPGDE